MKALLHTKQIHALEENTYSRLSIRSIDHLYYLLITIKNAAHVFVNRNGKRVEYQHDWQIKDWLLEKFDIELID